MENSLKASKQGLEIIHRAREQKGWNCQSAFWCKEAHTSLATLKRFLAGEAILRGTFVAICQAVGIPWEEVVEQTIPDDSCPIKYWHGVPDVSDFYGRSEELANLKQWIAAPCRLVALLGKGGIGKTALAVKLAEQIQPQFDYLIWYSLRPALPLEKVLTDLFEFFDKNSNSELTQNIQNTSDYILELMNFFRNHHCLLILDNLETILCSGDYAGDYREKYKNYGDLIRRMGEEQHQSCLIVTSREKTKEIAFLEGKDQPVRSYRLEGLKEAAWDILKAKGLSEEHHWGTLIQIYRGNPSILKMVGTIIKEIYDGRVGVFLKQTNTLVTGDVYTFIAQQFDRLSDVEKDILYQLAKQKKPVLFPDQFQKNLSVSSVELQRAIESVMRRSLIEKSASYFTLEPVVMEYVTNLLELKPEED